MRGVLVLDAEPAELSVRSAGRRLTLAIGPSTRLTGRPVWTPLLQGQRVRADVSRCGQRRTVRSIAALEPLVVAEEVSTRRDSALPGLPPVLQRGPALVVAGIGLAFALAIAAGWRAGRR